jgi:hypothetical protein
MAGGVAILTKPRNLAAALDVADEKSRFKYTGIEPTMPKLPKERIAKREKL